MWWRRCHRFWSPLSQFSQITPYKPASSSLRTISCFPECNYFRSHVLSTEALKAVICQFHHRLNHWAGHTGCDLHTNPLQVNCHLKLPRLSPSCPRQKLYEGLLMTSWQPQITVKETLFRRQVNNLTVDAPVLPHKNVNIPNIRELPVNIRMLGNTNVLAQFLANNI